ncbi:hypothetical protein [Halobaculum sp. MBLA0143]|uniref:hypothetical protein n=1 Tax=Halobaculum sp. MBLA0143 TaxID=3079933 RepID=UPI00352492A4
MQRRQFLAGVVTCGATGVSGCTASGTDESATVRVRNWGDSSVQARLSVTPERPGTRAYRNPETTPTNEAVTVGSEEFVEVTTIEPGAYGTVFRGGGHEATRCIRHEGDRSTYTFVVDEANVVFTAG